MRNKILFAREKRSETLNLLKEMYPQNVVICIKTNIVGIDKNLNFAHEITEYFDKYTESMYKRKYYLKQYTDDGLHIIKVLDSTDANSVKQEMIALEETHEVGRYIDIDVYKYGCASFSRMSYTHEARKCYICNEDAFICNRVKKHSDSVILNQMERDINNFFIAEKLSNLVFESMVAEVFAYPKFGCVSAVNSGCHKNMDVYTFLISSLALHKYFVKICLMSFSDENIVEVFKRSRIIGKEAEKAMFMATDDVNTHKGAIFVFGVLLIAICKSIYDKMDFAKIQSLVKEMTSGIVSEELAKVSDISASMTYGERAYMKSKLSGIRGEVEGGLQAVFNTGLPTFIGSADLCMNDQLVHTLIALMSVVEDTTLVHKSFDVGIINSVQQDAKELIFNGGFKGEIARNRVFDKTAEYIERQLSPGGSADLLAATYFLSKVELILK